MRVTNKMLSNNFLNDMQTNLNNLQTLQQQLTSGKEIRKPSDDPFKAARIMQLYSDIGANQQYNSNISTLKNWEDTTDTALNDAGNVLQRINELMVSAGNAAYGSDEMKAIKDEVNQKVEEFSQIMNTNYSGRYVFGGTRVTDKPTAFSVDGQGNTQLDYNILPTTGSQPLTAAQQKAQIQSTMAVEVSTGVTMDYNVPASDVLEYTTQNGTVRSMMDMFRTITANLDGNTVSASAASGTGSPLTNAINLGQDMTLGGTGMTVAAGTTLNLTNGMTVGSTAMNLAGSQSITLGADMNWTGGTINIGATTYNTGDTIPAGTVLTGVTVPANAQIPSGSTLSAGTDIPTGAVIKSGTTIPLGTVVNTSTTIPAKTITVSNGIADSAVQGAAKDAILNDTLQSVKDAINNILTVRATVGAKENRMDTAKVRNEAENDNMKTVLSSIEDIDITEKTMQYATMQTVYQASLQTSAKVIQHTLLDYL